MKRSPEIEQSQKYHTAVGTIHIKLYLVYSFMHKKQSHRREIDHLPFQLNHNLTDNMECYAVWLHMTRFRSYYVQIGRYIPLKAYHCCSR
jgi:hypothetical protein